MLTAQLRRTPEDAAEVKTSQPPATVPAYPIFSSLLTRISLHPLRRVVSCRVAYAAAAADAAAAAQMDSPSGRGERDGNPYELPNVDDLEVAALAAASAMQAMKELQQGASEEEVGIQGQALQCLLVLSWRRLCVCYGSLQSGLPRYIVAGMWWRPAGRDKSRSL
jgi:hypothetical protein